MALNGVHLLDDGQLQGGLGVSTETLGFHERSETTSMLETSQFDKKAG